MQGLSESLNRPHGQGYTQSTIFFMLPKDVKKYYFFGGQTVMRDANGLQYFLTDHLGSVMAVTSDTGTLITQQRYLPFGAERTNIGVITQTDLGYTGQRDLGMGLMDYHARFYSPYITRFSQPDTLIPNLYNLQSLNRYSYVENRPVNLSDPTGHRPCGDSYAVDCDGFRNHLGGSTGVSPGGDNNGGNNDGGGGDTGGDSNQESEPEIPLSPLVYGPPAPTACYQNSICMDTPNVDLHPYDTINPLMVGRIIVRSNNGEIIGYRTLTMIPDYQNYTLHWEIFTPKLIFQKTIDEATSRTIALNLEFMGKTTAASLFKKLSVALTGYDVLKISNQFLTFEEHSVRVGPLNPVKMVSPVPDFRNPSGIFSIP